MRNAFINQLIQLAKKKRKIVLLTGDLGFTVFEEFARKFPTRFFNMGVAEANMMGVACGMALTGLTPFVYSIATFATMRGFEQIRTDICLHNADVKIIGSGGGLSYGHAGSTHHSLEDIALMRLLPHMTVVSLSDSRLVESALPAVVNHKGPVYIRIGKKGEPIIYRTKPKFKIGNGIVFKNGNDAMIIATGNLVYNALSAATILEKKGICVGVIDMHTIKPIDKQLIQTLLKQKTPIFTVEEHFITGGLGSAVAEVISENLHKNSPFQRIGIPDEFIHSVGTQDYLRLTYGLTPEKIAKSIERKLKKYA